MSRSALRGARRGPVLACAVIAFAVVFPIHPADAGASLGTPQGYGAQTTGGSGARTIWVTRLGDSGPGTLRDAVEREDAAVVRFAVPGTIALQTRLLVGPNKTIDGRDRPVTITNRGLLLAEPNVIVESLRFDQIGDLSVKDHPSDAIDIQGARRVWISHNEFSRAADKAIQVTSGRDITIWANHFHHQSQVVQVSCFSCPDADRTRVSVHENWFDGSDVGYRMPTVNYGYVHAWNNYLTRWAYFGMASTRVGRLFSQSNVFEPGESLRATTYDNPSPDDKDPRYGYVRSLGDLALNGAEINEYKPTLVRNPRYTVAVERASTRLAGDVAATAGPRAA